MSKHSARQNRSELELNRENRNPPLDDQPTNARPGSEEKLVVLEDRYEKDVQLHHPDDAKLLIDKVFPAENPNDRFTEEFKEDE